jgi:hypothetical protein
MISSESKMFGAGTAVVATIVPENVIPLATKVLLAIVFAVISGFGFQLGTFLWNRARGIKQ